MSHAIKKASVAAFYIHPEGVRQSVGKLKKHGFDNQKLSIAGKGCRLCTCLFIFTGLGHIAVGGPLVGAIVREFEGGIDFRCITALRKALCSIGIPRECLCRYESALKISMCLVFASGGVDEITALKREFASSKAIEIAEHYS